MFGSLDAHKVVKEKQQPSSQQNYVTLIVDCLIWSRYDPEGLPISRSGTDPWALKRGWGGGSAPATIEKFTASPGFKNSTPQGFFLGETKKNFLGLSSNIFLGVCHNLYPKARQKVVTFFTWKPCNMVVKKANQTFLPLSLIAIFRWYK